MMEFVGFLVGVIGVAIGIKYRPRQSRLLFTGHGLGIIESGGIKQFSEDIEVRYVGKPVDRLASSIVVFWNSGPHMIDGSSIIHDDLIRCSFPSNCQVLRARVIRTTKETIGLKATVAAGNAAQVSIGFEYLDPRDGGAVELLHTGEVLYPAISGTIKDARLEDLGPIRDWPTSVPEPMPRGRSKPQRITYSDIVDETGHAMALVGRRLLGFAIFLGALALLGFLVQWLLPEFTEELFTRIYTEPERNPPPTSPGGRTVAMTLPLLFGLMAVLAVFIFMSWVLRSLVSIFSPGFWQKFSFRLRDLSVAARQRSLPNELNVWR